MQILDRAIEAYKAGDLEAALAALQPAVSPGAQANPVVMALKGNIHFKLGQRLDAAEAFAAAASGGVDKAPVLFKLAARLFSEERRIERLAAYGAAIVAANSDDAALAVEVGEAMLAEGRVWEMDGIIAALDRGNARHLSLIANTYRLAHRYDDLIDMLDTALEDAPNDPLLIGMRALVARETCDFEFTQRFEALMEPPLHPLAVEVMAREGALGRLSWSDDESSNALACQESMDCSVSHALFSRSPRLPISAPGRKLKIGYLSSDFFDHATMTLFFDVMNAHDTASIDFVLLCHTAPFVAAQQRNWPEKLKSRIVSIHNLSDADAATLIDGMGLDILVDLKGHTMGGRMSLVNRLRTPVKATYLGFPGSVVDVDLDYTITDRIVTPDESRPFYHEKLCRLPESYQANGSVTRAAPGVTSRAAQGLPEDAFVFASFNSPHKITADRLGRWADILASVPGSVLWCMCHVPRAVENIRAFLGDRGIAAERLIVTGMAAYPDHLARVRLADLVLDTHPYNGHTTTSDMLWAGVPVIAVRGQSFASRVSASLLNAIGLPELVAESEEEGVERAVALAGDPARLGAYRARIEAARFTAPLFDSERLARHLEAAYELMAERARAGLPPDHIDVPALPPRSAPFFARADFPASAPRDRLAG